MNHRADPIWNRTQTKVICRSCMGRLIGDGTTGNPHRHPGEPVEKGVVAK